MEDIFAYSVVFVITLTFDFIVNWFSIFGINIVATAGDHHPYEIGAIQGLIILLCIAQLIRKANDLKYYV